MRRRIRAVCILLLSFFVLTAPLVASAQGGPIEDAAPASSTPTPTLTATATATATPPLTPEPPPRPVRGPSVRERGGRRSRGASAASGALMLVMLIAFMGYYVIKKLRR